MTALLEIAGLEAGYGQSQVLFGLDLKVGAGTMSSLLGRNGMGKSTTVRAIMGLTVPSGGMVTFLGERIDGWGPDRIARAGVALVPEGRQIFPNLSVKENLVAFAANRSGSRNPWTLDRVFAFFPQLAERTGNLGGRLSGGEQQMLAIGRGLMSLPDLLMLDEPSLGLAPIVVKLVFDTREKIRAGGVTIVLVEQNVRKTLQHAETAYVLETGRIAMTGRGSDLLENPHVMKAYLGL